MTKRGGTWHTHASARKKKARGYRGMMRPDLGNWDVATVHGMCRPGVACCPASARHAP